MIDRAEALKLVEASGASPSLQKHALATEAVMRSLAERLRADADLWAITGLLHDLDYPATESAPERHGLEAATQLEQALPSEALQAIRAHNGEMNGCQPACQFDYALAAGETVTGLIAAAALMRPGRYDGMSVKSIRKKMKDKAFAANVNRAKIAQCQDAGLDLDEFLAIAIAAMAEQDKNSIQG